jgi:glycosyltransferase involved in cell wall biosynthesis
LEDEPVAADARPSALFLTPEPPYPLAGGGAIRSASLVEYLGRRYSLDLIVFREPGAPDPAKAIPPELVRSVQVLPLPRHSRRPLARMARTASRLVRGVPPLNDRFAGFGSALEAFLEGRHYEVALLEHFWCAPYWEQVAPHSKVVLLDLHNIESVLMARRAAAAGFPAGLVFRHFRRASLRLEQRWLPRFHALLAVSQNDAALLRDICPAAQVHVYPNALPWLPQPKVTEHHMIAFSGNLEYDPNADAVRYFYSRIWPLLRSRWPNLVWQLIGKNPEAVRRHVRGDPRVLLNGPPDNAIESLAAAQVVIAPVRVASGTRIKILEAWAAGRPVVATSIGAEGLPAKDGDHLWIADEPKQFAEAVSALLESADLRERLGRAGRRLFEAEFTWDAAWSKLRSAGI